MKGVFLKDHQAKARDIPSDPSQTFSLSPTWDIGIPFFIAAVPAGLFGLLRLISMGLNRPKAEISTVLSITMGVIITLGMIAMAIVILMRWENGFRQLSLRTDGRPALWRKFVLFLSILFILVFDCLTNIATAFAGAQFFLLFAAVAFIIYVCCLRMAFARI